MCRAVGSMRVAASQDVWLAAGLLGPCRSLGVCGLGQEVSPDRTLQMGLLGASGAGDEGGVAAPSSWAPSATAAPAPRESRALMGAVVCEASPTALGMQQCRNGVGPRFLLAPAKGHFHRFSSEGLRICKGTGGRGSSGGGLPGGRTPREGRSAAHGGRGALGLWVPGAP